MRSMLALLAAGTLACSEHAPTEAPPKVPRPYAAPADVRVAAASVRPGGDLVTVDGVTFTSREVVTLDLRNDGGSGYFYVEFWGPSASGTPVRLHESFIMPLDGGMERTEVWTIDVQARAIDGPPRVQSVAIYTRQPNRTYVETSRFTITDWQR